MIPYKIHYCWFGGGDIPQRERRCIESWKKLMPEFELVLWDEKRFDVNAVGFTKEAYKMKKYAFVSDYVRLYALINEGGIYLDTDVEVVKSLADFTKYKAFGSFETPHVVQTGVIGSIPNGALVSKMFEYYQNKSFVLDGGILNQVPNSKILTDILLEEGLVLNNLKQSLPSYEIFPTDYFCPIDQATREIIVTENTYCIHYLSGSWLSAKDRFTRGVKAFIGNRLGWGVVNAIRNLLVNDKKGL